MVHECNQNQRLEARHMDIPWFPKPFSSMVPLTSIVARLPNDKWEATPATQRGRSNTLAAYRQCAAQGVNPFIVPVVMDMFASQRFRTHTVLSCPCITKSRAATLGWWCSTTGGRLSVDELALLQGFSPATIDWKYCGIAGKDVCSVPRQCAIPKCRRSCAPSCLVPRKDY